MAILAFALVSLVFTVLSVLVGSAMIRVVIISAPTVLLSGLAAPVGAAVVGAITSGLAAIVRTTVIRAASGRGVAIGRAARQRTTLVVLALTPAVLLVCGSVGALPARSVGVVS